jgi:uncharacterized protein
MNEIPRLSKISLPPYCFKKHTSPHPTQHPDGHFRERETYNCPRLAENNWRDCEGYLFALDLFSQGYFWECHEVLEDLWHSVDNDSPVHHYLQAFIQCTVTHWQASSGRISAARNILRRIPRHVDRAEGLALGLSISDLHTATLSFVENPGPRPLPFHPK